MMHQQRSLPLSCSPVGERGGQDLSIHKIQRRDIQRNRTFDYTVRLPNTILEMFTASINRTCREQDGW